MPRWRTPRNSNDLLRSVEPTMFAARRHASDRFPALVFPSPGRRRHAHQPGEDPRQMALIGKSAIDRDLRGRNRRFEQQRLRLFDPTYLQPLVWRHAGRHAKRPDEVTARKSARLGEVGHKDVAAQVARQVFLRALILNQGKPSGPGRFAWDDASVTLGEMGN